jgi:hypothetical protein
MQQQQQTLTDVFNEVGGDKGSYFAHVGSTENIAHNYAEVYDRIMKPYKDTPFNLLEIGLWCPFFPGASVKAWPAYFEKVTYYGVDIVDCTHLASERVNIDIVDQRSESSITNYLQDKPKFKFIIDDGCHEEDAITISLGSLFPVLESGGVYFIEDLHVVDKSRLYNLMNKQFQSPYIDQDKLDYINNNIDKCYFENNGKLCIIHKK